MSFIREISVGLQVAETAKLYEINEAVQELRDVISARDELTRLRDDAQESVYRFVQLLRDAQTNMPGTVAACYRAECFERWMRVAGVSTATFDSVANKEHFAEACDLAAGLRREATANLDNSQRAKIQQLFWAPQILAVLRTLSAWMEVSRKCIGGHLMWPGINSLIWAWLLMGGQFLVGKILLKMAHMDSFGNLLNLGAFCLIGPSLLNYWRYRQAIRLDSLVASVGGTFTKETALGSVEQFIEALKLRLRNERWSFHVNSLEDVRMALASAEKWTRETSSELGLDYTEFSWMERRQREAVGILEQDDPEQFSEAV